MIHSLRASGRAVLRATHATALLSAAIVSWTPAAAASTPNDHQPTPEQRDAARSYVAEHPEEFEGGPSEAEKITMSVQNDGSYPVSSEDVPTSINVASTPVGEVEFDTCTIQTLNWHNVNIPNRWIGEGWTYAGQANSDEGAATCETDTGTIYVGVSFHGEASVRGCNEPSTSLVLYGQLTIGRRSMPAQIGVGIGTPTSAAIHTGPDPYRDLTGALAVSLLDSNYQHVNRCGPSANIRHIYAGGSWNRVDIAETEQLAYDSVTSVVENPDALPAEPSTGAEESDEAVAADQSGAWIALDEVVAERVQSGDISLDQGMVESAARGRPPYHCSAEITRKVGGVREVSDSPGTVKQRSVYWTGTLTCRGGQQAIYYKGYSFYDRLDYNAWRLAGEGSQYATARTGPVMTAKTKGRGLEIGPRKAKRIQWDSRIELPPPYQWANTQPRPKLVGINEDASTCNPYVATDFPAYLNGLHCRLYSYRFK